MCIIYSIPSLTMTTYNYENLVCKIRSCSIFTVRCSLESLNIQHTCVMVHIYSCVICWFKFSFSVRTVASIPHYKVKDYKMLKMWSGRMLRVDCKMVDSHYKVMQQRKDKIIFYDDLVNKILFSILIGALLFVA